MNESVWLEYLKEHRIDLYEEAKKHLEEQSVLNKNLESKLAQDRISLEKYQNTISFNGIYCGK